MIFLKNKLKNTPTIYLVSIILLIIYGFIGNYVVFRTQNIELLSTLNKINITLTFFWLFFNIFLIYFFYSGKYESEAKILAIYYTIINSFNISNIVFGYISNYKFLFWFSIITKSIEAFIAIKLIFRNLRKRKLH